MRRISCAKVAKTVANLCQEANLFLPSDVLASLNYAASREVSPLGQAALSQILENNKIAAEEKIPICQDCGTAVVFLEMGNEVRIISGNLFDAVNEGVRQGYKDGYLRKSLCHPLTRKNTGDNTPAVIHLYMVPGDKLKIIVCPKGGGAENMSRLAMLSPSVGKDGIKKFVIGTVEQAGFNSCPPIVVGVGIGGGTFERAAFLAKKALLRSTNTPNTDGELNLLEYELYSAINKLGMGPAGLGGSRTALAVFIGMEPCHIASLPVAVNINCHAARHKEAIL
ncbi:MAG: fumarate hydratase [Candidatus Nealsonbacteria bacterium]|nr:fumarate hydratase [Candidatus Nealsonbacteria bacterium]